MKGARSAQAFTLVELLAAMLFLAIVIPAVSGGISVASRAGEMAERSANAAQLAENKMNELVLGNAWNTSDRSGTFGDAWLGYRWQLTDAQWAADTMTELTLEVFFSVRGHEHSVRAVTLASNTITRS